MKFSCCAKSELQSMLVAGPCVTLPHTDNILSAMEIQAKHQPDQKGTQALPRRVTDWLWAFFIMVQVA